MSKLNFKSIITLHEIYEAEKSYYLILDLMEGGSLNDYFLGEN